MIVKSLAMMEKIVAKNSNLVWEGWDVLDLKESNLAKTANNGIRIKNKWYLHKRYVPNRDGWMIPDKYRKK